VRPSSTTLGAGPLGILFTLRGDSPGLPTEETQTAALKILDAIESGTTTTASYGVGELRDLRRRAEMPIKELRSEIRLGRARAKRNPRSQGGLISPRWNAPIGPCSAVIDGGAPGRSKNSTARYPRDDW